MFNLNNKSILLISPNQWGKMFVSKHHYAVELAALGNKVYFLNPPDYAQKESVKIVKHPSIPNLTIITYRPFLPYFLRFHFRKLYDLLVKFETKKIIRAIGTKIDLLWCFDANLYSDLSFFEASKVIFHPVDLVNQVHQIKPGNKADYIFSVSETILNKYSETSTPKYLINHGLGSELAKFALENQPSANVTNSVIRAGYIGNLLIDTFDRVTVKNLIEKYPDVEFHFVGPCTTKESNIGGNPDAEKFISVLRQFPNVILHGVIQAVDLTQFLPKMDLFFLSYNTSMGLYDGSNSHKILEYMSTGKVIVSNYISSYDNKRELIQMLSTEQEGGLVILFGETIRKLDYYNSPELQLKRKDFALNNTYTKQIERISQIIANGA